jgi:spore coat polysaccharide biosynthesis predicted glycosyltransferase SpsG
MRSDNVLLVVNGNRTIGYGHISRTKILVEELISRGFNICFLTLTDCLFVDEIKTYSSDTLQVSSFETTEKETILRYINDQNINIVLIDLIEKEYSDLNWIRAAQPKLFLVTVTLFLFDYTKRYEHLSFFPDLDATLSGSYRGYNGLFDLYSGPDYFTFREEFRNLVPVIKETAQNVLITMGGSDPFGITLKVLRTIKDLEYSVTVILSEISNTYEHVKKIVESNPKFELLEKSHSIAQLMLDSDLIIINGGLTRYEACLIGIPFIALSIHERQYLITKRLTDQGVGINLGISHALSNSKIKNGLIDLMNSFSRRKEMSKNMKGLFDYNGGKRIVDEIVKTKKAREENY